MKIKTLKSEAMPFKPLHFNFAKIKFFFDKEFTFKRKIKSLLALKIIVGSVALICLWLVFSESMFKMNASIKASVFSANNTYPKSSKNSNSNPADQNTKPSREAQMKSESATESLVKTSLLPQQQLKTQTPQKTSDSPAPHNPYALSNSDVNHLKTLLLPLPKNGYTHAMPLLPAPTSNSQNEITGTNNTDNNEHPAQSCLYNGQSYLPGDIVKTKDGWIRCTPTLSFSINFPTKQQSGNPTWTHVQ